MILLSKTQRLMLFQIDQAPKMIIEWSPCLISPSTLELASDHQSSKDGTVGCGERLCDPPLRSNKNQNSWANTQPTCKWLIFLGSWSQRGQWVGCGQFYQLSNICCEPLETTHKKLTFAWCPRSPNSVMVLIHRILF